MHANQELSDLTFVESVYGSEFKIVYGKHKGVPSIQGVILLRQRKGQCVVTDLLLSKLKGSLLLS